MRQALALPFVLLAFTPLAAASESRLPSGGFESDALDPGGMPLVPGWRRQGEGAGLDTQVVHSGTSAARISVPSLSQVKTQWQLWQTSPSLPAPQGQFRLSAWLKTRAVTQGREAQWHNCRGYLSVHDADGKRIKMIPLFGETGTSEWRQVATTFRMPARSANMSFTFILYRCQGEAWLDDVRLEALGEGTRDEAQELRRLNIAEGPGRKQERVLGWASQGSADWARGTAHSGQRSLHIAIKTWDQASPWHLWRSERMDCPEGKLTFSAWARAANVVPGKGPRDRARCYLSFYAGDGKGAGLGELFAIHGISEWRRYERVIAAPARAKTMEVIAIVYGCSGEMWIDDFALLDAQGRNLLSNPSVEDALAEVRLDIAPVPMGAQPQPGGDPYPAGATNVRISEDGNFTRNGRPVFLIGAVQSGMGYPWLCRTLGVDFCVINSTGSPHSTAHFRLRGDTMHVSFRDHDYVGTEVRELLVNGLLPYISLHETGWRKDPLRHVRPDLMATGGHYFSYSDCLPEGRALRAALRKSILKSTRRFPIFLYELFNEVNYMSNARPNVARFRRLAAERYGTVAAANRAWGTSYRAFGEVEPPYQPDARYKSGWQRGWSEPLWFDWVKFNEDRFAEICLGQRQLVKTHDPKPNTFITVQSYFTGELAAMGAHPRKKVAAEDVYGHEMYMAITPQPHSAENWDEIVAAMRFCMSADLVAAAAPHKPIINEEAGVLPGLKRQTSGSLLLHGHGEWRFAEDNADAGEAAGHFRADFDAAAWGTIRVPGLWGPQGHRQCSIGWYRRDFVMPKHEGRVWLNGHELTDDATLWLNGQRVYRTRRWNDLFSLDVTRLVKPGKRNVLAIKIVNRYFEGGMYYGGIRRYLDLSAVSSDPVPITPGQMRIYLWQSVIRGMSGTVFFNLFAHEGAEREFDPRRVERAAIHAIPAIRQEINALAHVVLPRPRRRAKVALYYSYASSRGHVPQDATEWVRGHVSPVLARYYAALTLARVPFDVVDSYTVLNRELSRYRALVVAAAPRVPGKVVDELARWVAEGGRALVGPGCFTTNDDDHSPLAADKLLASQGVVTLEEELALDSLSQRVAGFAGDVRPGGLRVADDRGGFLPVEAHALGQGRLRVWYLCNWGAGRRRVRVHPTDEWPEAGAWRLSTSDTPGAQFQGLSDAPFPAARVREGVSVSLKSQEPVLVLVEPWDAEPLRWRPMPDRGALRRAWGPSPKAERKVLVSCLGRYVTRDKIPSAKLLLEANGFQVDAVRGALGRRAELVGAGRDTAELADYDVLCILSGTTRPYAAEERQAVREFVEQGGGLLAAGNFYRNPHAHFTNSLLNMVLDPFGVAINDDSVLHPEANTLQFERFPVFADFSAHVIGRGVRAWVSHGSASLTVKGQGAVVARSAPNAERIVGRYEREPGAGLPVLAAAAFGKGRVVVFGDGGWLLPDWLARGGNARLLCNAVNWLTGAAEPPEPKGLDAVVELARIGGR